MLNYPVLVLVVGALVPWVSPELSFNPVVQGAVTEHLTSPTHVHCGP